MILNQLISTKERIKIVLGLIVIFVLLLSSSDNSAHATCIILYIGKREILIGADSRNVKKAYNSDSLEYLQTCKIKTFDRLTFVMSGFTNSDSYDFKPYQLAERHFSTDENFDTKLKSLKIEINERLSEILRKIKTNPKSWQMVVTKENRILEIGIIGSINGQFGVYRIGFVLTDNETMRIETQEEMTACTYTTDKYLGFGDSDASREYIIANLGKETADKIIINAIKKQSAATPITVGEPINLLRVKPDSLDWLVNNCCNE